MSQAPSHNACPTCLCPSGVLPFKPMPPLLFAGRETKSQEEDDRPPRAWREASKASWSGFEVNQWAERNKDSRKKRKSCRQTQKKRLRKSMRAGVKGWNRRSCEQIVVWSAKERRVYQEE
ncbi:hypothetical protein Q5P01_012430 [Channa striata]|uniref:Uncharacterized protein n=1 Tax=Channa striata TaxID=64152 RepID=A0AA88ST03_CHASR|nr:hypothetical protein Q5P01_012430 [Channa striata]